MSRRLQACSADSWKVRAGTSLGVVSALAGLLAACGAEQASRPEPTPTPAPAAEAMTVLTVVSGRDQKPVGEATVRIGGIQYPLGPGGTVTLDSRVEFGAPVEIEAAGFFPRTTRLRESDPRRFTLWPKELASAAEDDKYTSRLVYTSTTDGSPLGGEALYTFRPGTELVTLVIDPSLFIFQYHMSDHETAAREMNAVLSPNLTYQVSKDRPTSGIIIDVRYDEKDASCKDAWAFARWQLMGNTITGGEIVYCDRWSVNSKIATHEVGHTMGLRHSAEQFDIMYPYVNYNPDFQRHGFGESEGILMKMMRQRWPGNRLPDDDRDLYAKAVLRTETIVCR